MDKDRKVYYVFYNEPQGRLLEYELHLKQLCVLSCRPFVVNTFSISPEDLGRPPEDLERPPEDLK
jgi:hypothetical protein